MAVTYSNKGTMGYGTGAVNATVPSGYAEGDLLVLVISGRNALPNAPSGWTSIGAASNAGKIYNRTCYKIATSSESTVVVADSGSYTTALMLLFKGNDTTNPINISTTNTRGSTAFSATGVTTTKDNCMIVHCTAFQDAGTSVDGTNYSAPPSNANLSSLTERHDYYYRSGTDINGGIYVVTGLKATAGDTGNTTSTADSSLNYSAVVTFAIAPPIPHTLTITYKDAQGNTLATSHSSQVNEGAGYSVNSPTVAGYTPDQAIVSGTMGTSDVTIDVVYSVETFTLTINYKDKFGSAIATAHISEHENGAGYSVNSPIIDGYKYTQEVVSGTIDASDVTVDVVYFAPEIIPVGINMQITGEGLLRFTPSAPGLIFEGDFLVLLICGRYDLPALPTGWTNIGTSVNGSDIYNRTCYKFAEANESEITIQDSGAFTYVSMTAYRNVDTTNPINAVTTSISSGVNFSANGVTTTAINCLVVHATAFQDAGIEFDYHNYVNPTNANLSYFGDFGGNSYEYGVNSGAGYYNLIGIKGVAGATGTTTATADSVDNKSATVTFALKPSEIIFPAVVKRWTYVYGEGEISIPVHESCRAWDLLVLSISARSSAPNLPSGWINIGTVNNADNIYNRTCYRIATASESTISIADTGVYTMATVLGIRGQDPLTPINAVSTSTSDGVNFSADGLTTTVNNCLIEYSIAQMDDATEPDYYSNIDLFENANLSRLELHMDSILYVSAGIEAGLSIRTGIKPTKGAIGTATGTTDSANHHSATVAFAVSPFPPPIITHALTITYKDGLGNTLSPTYEAAVGEDVGYSVNSPTVSGYIPDQTAVSGTMGTVDVNVDVVYYALIDEYPSENVTAGGTSAAGKAFKIGQAFTSASYPSRLRSCRFYLSKSGTLNPTDALISAKLYAMTGTYGSTGIPTGSPLATSTSVLFSSVPSSYGWVEFTFPTAYTLNANTNYCISVEIDTTIVSGSLIVCFDGIPPTTHDGNAFNWKSDYGGYWSNVSSQDVIFEVYGEGLYIPHTLTITYKDTLGNTVATSHSSELNEGSAYSITSPTIIDYTPDQAIVSGTMGTSDVNVEVVYALSPCILTLTPTVTKIAGSGTSSVSVSSNINAVAFEARATLEGQSYGRGIGIDIVQDDVSVAAGVHTFVSPTKSWSFDIAYSEIGTDGLYRISVYAQNEDGVWSS